MIRTLWVGLVALACMGASPAAAKSRLFSDDAPLKIVISAPFPALVRAAPTSTKPFAAALSVAEGAGPAQSVPIQLSARGLTRRTAGYCQFPPLALKFDKATVRGTPFQGQNKLKLVTYCRPQADYEQHIVLEYLAYRLYNLITPMSYRVRAADVTYRKDDSDAGVTRFGFLVEDIDDVADRNDRDRLTAASHQVSATQLDAHAAARVTLFEYMIGNLDWELLASAPGTDCCHNSRFIAARGATPATASAVVPVPYDFDFSGLVDAPYSGPPDGIPVSRLTERYYRGYCVSNGEIPAVAQEYRAHRAEMMALIDGEPRLNPTFRAKTDRFMEGFFALLDDPGRIQSQIVRRCR
ncbi:MAG TPA: hypothetical protein VF459_18350 [Caulobacteraceae bacterium]